jgi:hypothetical protein
METQFIKKINPVRMFISSFLVTLRSRSYPRMYPKKKRKMGKKMRIKPILNSADIVEKLESLKTE